MNTDGDHAQRTAQAAFVYELTLADLQGVVRVRARRTAAGRVETLLIPLATTAPVVVFALFRGLLPVAVATGAVLGLGAGILGVVRSRRGLARRLHAVWAAYGQCRTVVDDRGAATTGETMSYTADWKLFTHYAETPDLFVLVGGPRASCLAAVPKRGAEGPADVDRLRAILDAHLRRL
ncbi:YcxB family protein [Streptomyces erythrochromogenes]|uniref:YcxB family protein n=1 Tax=Streptomyces erythrochromogenes TaxID=285574 RepID=UPI0036979C16